MIKRKPLAHKPGEEEKQLGPKPRKLHRSVKVSDLDDAVVLNEAQDGFRLDVNTGDRIVVERPLDGGRFVSLCQVLSVEAGPDGAIETWDETRGQCFCFTPNTAAIHYDTLTIKKLGAARTCWA